MGDRLLKIRACPPHRKRHLWPAGAVSRNQRPELSLPYRPVERI